jgi:hypothetical protein
MVEELLISFYERGTKTLLQKKLKFRKKSITWRRISHIQHLVLTAMEVAECRPGGPTEADAS